MGIVQPQPQIEEGILLTSGSEGEEVKGEEVKGEEVKEHLITIQNIIPDVPVADVPVVDGLMFDREEDKTKVFYNDWSCTDTPEKLMQLINDEKDSIRKNYKGTSNLYNDVQGKPIKSDASYLTLQKLEDMKPHWLKKLEDNILCGKTPRALSVDDDDKNLGIKGDDVSTSSIPPLPLYSNLDVESIFTECKISPNDTMYNYIKKKYKEKLQEQLTKNFNNMVDRILDKHVGYVVERNSYIINQQMETIVKRLISHNEL